jgi:hypothetical protein
MTITTTGTATLGSLADKILDMTAGMPVDAAAFHKYGLNMAKLKTLATGFKQGWLHNLMARVTPITLRSADDYVMMAELFIPNASTAMHVLENMSADLTTFATSAGLAYSAPEMAAHRQLYGRIAVALSAKFEFAAPAPFAPTVISAADQYKMSFVRNFLEERGHKKQIPAFAYEY